MRILIADDHTIVRNGIKLVLVEAYPFAEIADVSNAEELLKLVQSQQWDVVICDISMPPGESGLEAVKQIRAHHANLPVIILSMHPADLYAVRAIKAGATGFLNKGAATKELVTAVNTVLSGKKYLDQEVAELLAEAFEHDTHNRNIDNLSDRELEVFKLIAKGRSIADIATELKLSPNTISTFRNRLCDKMGFANNLELIRYALDNGYA